MAVIAVTVSRVPTPVIVNLYAAIIPKECHEQKAEHVKRSDERGDGADQPVNPVRLVRLPQDFVLAPETSEGGNSGDRERRDEHGQERPGNVRTQAAHLAHVLLAAHGRSE